MEQPARVRIVLGRPHLDGWKEIAGYLGRTVRTVQRWERTEGLPIRRHRHADLASVYADPTELDRWRAKHQSLQSASGVPTLGEASGDERVLHEIGVEYLRRRTREGFQQAMALAHTALTINPEYAPAYGLLALVHQSRATYGYRPPLEDLRLAREYADRALILDPQSVEALQALGFVFIFMREWIQAEALFQRLHALNAENPTTLQYHSILYLAQGRLDDACTLSLEAEHLAPETPLFAVHAAWTLHSAGRFIEAIAKARAVIERERVFWRGYFNLALSLLAVGRTQEALRAAEISSALSQNSCVEALHAHTLSRVGDLTRAKALTARMRRGRGYISPYWLAFALTGLGDYQAAESCLRRSIQQREWFVIFLEREPGFALVRERPAYATVRSNLGLL
ncbi:MAG: hypothetical protein HOP16_18750 [Acidobacteria bacterium]|nr:hypothetical protein [Acidobacteriota bacterium]